MLLRVPKKLLVVLLLAVCVIALTAAVKKTHTSRYSPFDKEFYLTDEQIAFVRPGLNVEVIDHAIAADGTVTVDFTVADDGGLPLDINGVETPGAIRLSFIIGRIPQGSSTYVAYATRTTGGAVQPTADSGGTFTLLAPGAYRYTFGKKLPDGYDQTVTHTIGYYGDRTLTEWGLGAPMADGTFNFVPAGGDVVDVRQLATNEACAQCHDNLIAHGRRHSLELCIMCHYPGVTDPDSGNSVDMPVMAHKIHMGNKLTNGYTIVGYGGTAYDFSEVTYPQDQRYCDTCHVAGAAQAEKAFTNPTRAACGACHDTVDFATGVNHPVATDEQCAFCHLPEGELEFDASVKGAHTIPSESRQLAGVNVDILDVQCEGPGTAPVVLFTVTNDAGEDILPANMDRLRFQIAGPTTDYSIQTTVDAKATATPVGVVPTVYGTQATTYTYTSSYVIPEDATGTFAIAPEARTVVALDPAPEGVTTQRDPSENPVTYFAVTDEEAVPRRAVVDDAKCESCHRNLALHGENRHGGGDLCQFCHNPLAGDEEDPPQTISFQVMVHKIHMGDELTRDYTIGRANYNEVTYPSARTNCMKCHVDDSWAKGKGALSTVTEKDFFSPQPPTTAACLACHDGVGAASHAYKAIAPFGEACMACHGTGKEYAVAKEHAQ